MISRMGTLVGASGGKLDTFEDNVTSEYYTELLKSSSFLEIIAHKKLKSKKFGEVDLVAYYKVEGRTNCKSCSRRLVPYPVPLRFRWTG